jgi:hypothetical protein
LFGSWKVNEQDVLATTFCKGARFWGAKVEGAAEFNGCEFRGSSNFTYLEVKGAATFLGVRFEESVILAGARFGVLSFGDDEHTATLTGSINLLGCTYESIDNAWRTLLPKIAPFDRQPYNQLERFLRSRGRDREAGEVYLERRKCERALAKREVMGRGTAFRERLQALPHLASEVTQWVLFQYGVRPVRLLVVTGVFIMVGLFVFATPGAVEPREIRAPGTAVRDFTKTPLSLYEALGFSLRTFIPIVELPVGTRWVPSSTPLWGTAVTVDAYASAHRLAGAILVPLGVAALTGLLFRRDKSTG